MQDLGFTSWFSRSTSLEAAFRHLATAGCSQVEVAAMPYLISKWRSVGMLLDKYGMKATAVSLGVPFFFSESRLDLHSIRMDVRDSSVKYARQAIDFSSQIGAEIIYACSMERGPADEREGALERLAESLATCADSANSAGLRLAIEPFPTGELSSVHDAVAFTDHTEVRNVGIVLDTGHIAISGERLAKAVDESGDKIIHVHLNNNDGVSDLHWPPQEGVLSEADFEELFSALASRSYSGRVSVELTKPRPVVGTIIKTRTFVEAVIGRAGCRASPAFRTAS